MFDFAWSHYALLLIVAVTLLGPKEIPVVLRFVGRWVTRIRCHVDEWREYVEYMGTQSDEPVSVKKKISPEKVDDQ